MIAEEIVANIETKITLAALIAFSGVAASVILAISPLVALSRIPTSIRYRISLLLGTAGFIHLGSTCSIMLYGGILAHRKYLLLASYYSIIIATLLVVLVALLFGLFASREIRMFGKIRPDDV